MHCVYTRRMVFSVCPACRCRSRESRMEAGKSRSPVYDHDHARPKLPTGVCTQRPTADSDSSVIESTFSVACIQDRIEEDMRSFIGCRYRRMASVHPRRFNPKLGHRLVRSSLQVFGLHAQFDASVYIKRWMVFSLGNRASPSEVHSARNTSALTR